MLESFNDVLSPRQLSLYIGLFDQQSSTFHHHIQVEIAQQLVTAIGHDLLAEPIRCDWQAVLNNRIDNFVVANCDRLPNESECELVYGFIVLLQEIFQNQKEVIDKEKHEHAKNLSIIQFERMNERMTLEKVCGELRDQLTTQINILFVTQNQLASEREQAKALKESILADTAKFSDQICLKDSIIKELKRKLKDYSEHITDMEKAIDWADYNADLLRLRLYQMGLKQQRLDHVDHLNKLQSMLARQRMYETLYQYIDNIHKQIDSFKHLTLDEFDFNLFQKQECVKDDCQLLKECQHALNNFAFIYQQRLKCLKLQYEQNSRTILKEMLIKQQALKEELSNSCKKIHLVEQQLNKQEELIANLNSSIKSLQDKETMSMAKLSEVERVCSQYRQTLETTEADSKVLKAIIKNFESSNESLRMEKNSLQQNLLLVSQLSSQQKESVEEEFIKQKNIVEQVVERNFEYKLRNRELQIQLATLRDNYDRLREDFEKDIHEYCVINQNLKHQILSKDDAIERLGAEINEKDHHIYQVNQKIQLLEDQLSVIEELHHCNDLLEAKLCKSEEKLAVAAETDERIRVELKSLYLEKTELEAEMTVLKQMQTTIIENGKQLKDDANIISRLNLELDGCHQRIQYLEEEVQTLSKNISIINDQNHQLKNKMINLMEGYMAKPALNEQPLRKQPDERNDSLNFQRNINLQETLKNKENIAPFMKEKYTQSIMNLNQLINYMMNYVKGYSFSDQHHIREGSWIWSHGNTYVKKMQSSTNIQGKVCNYLQVSQIAANDPRIKEVCDTFTTIMDSYFARINNK